MELYLHSKIRLHGVALSLKKAQKLQMNTISINKKLIHSAMTFYSPVIIFMLQVTNCINCFYDGTLQ